MTNMMEKTSMENSKTGSEKKPELRYSNAPWFSKKKEITVIGLGGVGLGLAHHFANLDHILTVWDGDRVETHNCRPQGFWPEDIGDKKTDAFVNMASVMFEKVSNIRTRSVMWKPGDNLDNIVVMAADDMDNANIPSFEQWALMENRELYIDVRLQAEAFEVYFVTPGMEEEYRKTLFKNKEAEGQIQCSYRQTRAMAQMSHCYVISQFNNWLLNYPSVSFYSSYNGPLNAWKYA